MPLLASLLLPLLLLAPGLSPVPAGQGVWPLQPRPAVVRGFDPPDSPYGRGHRGVDLAGHVGQAVHTSLAGTVTFAGSLAGRGVVVVDHGPVRTTYEPVTASVAVGAAVGRGQPIGVLALTGSHCVPRACLHWGLLQGETYLDPLLLVGGLPVRLLPLDAAPVSRMVPLGVDARGSVRPALRPGMAALGARSAAAVGADERGVR